MHDFNLLRDFLGPIILIVIILIGFGVMSGANTKALVSAFLDLVVSLLKVVLIAAAKLIPPLANALILGLKFITNKLLGVAIKALEHKPTEQQQSPPPVTSTTTPPTPGGQTTPPETPPQTEAKKPPTDGAGSVVSGLKKAYDVTAPKKPPANPFEEDEEIQIIEKN